MDAKRQMGEGKRKQSCNFFVNHTNTE